MVSGDALSTSDTSDDERRLRLVIEATPNAMVMVDERGRVVLVNSQTEALFGYSRDELLAMDVEQLIPARLRGRHRTYRGGFFGSPDARAMGAGRDLYGLRKDGSEVPIEIGLNPLETDEGMFVLASIIDITERKRSEERLLHVVEAAPNAMIMVNDPGSIVLVNTQAERSFGYSREELLTMRVEDLLPERFQRQHTSFREGFFMRPNRREMGAGRDLFGRRKDGTEIPIEIGLNPIQIDDESFVLASIIDITERVTAQATQNAVQQDRLRRSIMDSLPFSIIATDRSGTIVTANPAAERLLGYRQSELVGSSISVVQEGPGPMADPEHPSEASLAGQEREWVYRRKDGSRVPVNEAITPMSAADGEPTGFLTVAYDITMRIKAQAEVRHMAQHDVLTDLPNRTTLQNHLVNAIARAEQTGTAIAVVLLDLDHFKRVNDSLGHHVGDELLLTMAARLRGCVREGDLVARLGGDEFVVVFSDLEETEHLVRRIDDLRHAVLAPLVVHGHELTVTASAGGAIHPQHGGEPSALLKNADTAMYHAKSSGRNNFQWFFEAMLDETNDKIALSSALRQAIARDELSLVYQPLLSLDSGEVVGMEALTRWHSPELGEVAPDRFIPVAEDGGMIAQLGEWVLGHACRDAMRISEELGRTVRLAVNVSPRQVHHQDLLAVVDAALAATGFDPADLELEVTEGILMDDPREVIEVLHALRARGIKIVVDDFGTGFSSLGYLTRFPIDKIKIDRSFIRDVTADDADAAIVDTIIVMAHTLGMTVVAEGIETAAQETYLRDRGCDEAQGHRYSPGIPAGLVAPSVRRLSDGSGPPLAPVPV